MQRYADANGPGTGGGCENWCPINCPEGQMACPGGQDAAGDYCDSFNRYLLVQKYCKMVGCCDRLLIVTLLIFLTVSQYPIITVKSGCRAGNEKKLISSQAQLGKATYLAVA